MIILELFLALVGGIGCFCGGWYGCIHYHKARRMTITTLNETYNVYIGPYRALISQKELV